MLQQFTLDLVNLILDLSLLFCKSLSTYLSLILYRLSIRLQPHLITSNLVSIYFKLVVSLSQQCLKPLQLLFNEIILSFDLVIINIFQNILFFSYLLFQHIVLLFKLNCISNNLRLLSLQISQLLLEFSYCLYLWLKYSEPHCLQVFSYFLAIFQRYSIDLRSFQLILDSLELLNFYLHREQSSFHFLEFLINFCFFFSL